MALKKQFSFSNALVIDNAVVRFEEFRLFRSAPTKPEIDVLFYKDESTMAADGPPLESGRETLFMTGFDPTNIRNQIHNWLVTQPEFSGGTVVAGGVLKALTLPSGVEILSAVARVHEFRIERRDPTKPTMEVAIFKDQDAADSNADPVRYRQFTMSGFNPINTRNQVYAWILTQERFLGAVTVPD